MANSVIKPSEHAPAEAVHFSFASGAFDLASGGTYESADEALLADAASHPWLVVERPAATASAVQVVSPHVAEKDDPFSAVNYHGNDPDAVAAAEADKHSAVNVIPAIDAGEDQSASVQTGNVAETLKAFETPAAPEAPADNPTDGA